MSWFPREFRVPQKIVLERKPRDSCQTVSRTWNYLLVNLLRFLAKLILPCGRSSGRSLKSLHRIFGTIAPALGYRLSPDPVLSMQVHERSKCPRPRGRTCLRLHNRKLQKIVQGTMHSFTVKFTHRAVSTCLTLTCTRLEVVWTYVSRTDFILQVERQRTRELTLQEAQTTSKCISLRLMAIDSAKSVSCCTETMYITVPTGI